MSLRPFVLATAVLSLAACASPTAPPVAGRCDAGATTPFVGRVADAATIESARKAAGADRARTLKPGQMVTMEYLEGRLNLYLDGNGRIERIACG